MILFKKFMIHIMVSFCVFLVIFPVFWIILESIKPDHLSGQTNVFIFNPTIKNWQEVFFESLVPVSIWNSLLVALSTVSISIVLGAPAAYAIARYQVTDSIKFSILLSEMLPPAILLLPLFLILYQLRLIDSLIGVVVTHLTFVVPVITWFLIGFFNEIPRELEEQAMVDGFSRQKAFVYIVLPLAKPGLGAAAIFGFVLSWNDLFYALILTGPETRTLPVAIAGFWTFRGVDMPSMAVAIVISIVPVIVLAFYVQKYLIRGITGGMKQ